MTDHKSIDTLAFDFDGVLANTERLYWRSWAEIFEPRGIPFTWEHYCKVGRGIPDVEMLSTMRQNPEYRSALAGVEEQNGFRKQKVREWCLTQPPIATGTIAMLHALEGFRIGLVTSSAKCDVEPVLRAAGIDACFDSMVFGEDVKLHKPAPEPYLLVRKKLGMSVGLAFEDSNPGITSAQQAGFTVIRVDDPDQLPLLVERALSR